MFNLFFSIQEFNIHARIIVQQCKFKRRKITGWTNATNSAKPIPNDKHRYKHLYFGQKDLLIIDPGPNSEAHLRNIMEVIPDNTKVTHILITHSHLDHSALAPKLSKILNAPTLAFGTALDGLSNDMKNLCEMGLTSENLELILNLSQITFWKTKKK